MEEGGGEGVWAEGGRFARIFLFDSLCDLCVTLFRAQ